MAKHNKWSKVKRLKAVTDARKGKVFSRLARDITMAAKAGGGDPAGNARLRTLLLKAREANMPADNVDRAIKKGTGELPGVVFEEITYEGYGPGGVAFVVKCTTDNRQRATQDVRSAFTEHGGNLAQNGAVAFQFLHAGQFLIAREKTTEDALMELALAAGADDIITTDEGYEVRCDVRAFDRVAHDYGSPGRVFKLDEGAVADRLMALEALTDGDIQWTEQAGIRQVTRKGRALTDIDDTMTKVLRAGYGRR